MSSINIIKENSLKQFMKEISQFVYKASDIINDSEVNTLISILLDVLQNNKKILIVGVGRSGLAGKAFAMRLMHLGFNVYVLGDTITPAVYEGDVVIAISGSGTTRLVITAASAAKEVRAKVIAITSHRDSPLAKIADHIVIVPGRTKIATESDYTIRQILGEHEPLVPLGTLFEITLNVFFDSLVAELMQRLGKTEQDLKKRHATIE
ncbi:MAG: 6-phospho-3-hexuloisomerase [Candidatus Methanomethylicia archaeon]|jgi:6-phospho-3-hexuloisomerase|nr:6-phospho-3-hexuloisomerase [Candidatus Methanomethylicia archaeon]